MRIIKRINRTIVIKNIEYPVEIIYKTGKKNISYRYKDNKFIITSPLLARMSTIEDGLIKFAPKLMSFKQKEKLWDTDFIYILGNRYEIKDNLLIIDENTTYPIKDLTTFKKKLIKWFKSVISVYVEEYKTKMGINVDLKVHVKDMKTRYGSYSAHTQSLSFGLELMHYDIEMAKSVVVHELSHYYVYNHSKKFYDMVLKYYPNYFEIHDKLRKGLVK